MRKSAPAEAFQRISDRNQRVAEASAGLPAGCPKDPGQYGEGGGQGFQSRPGRQLTQVRQAKACAVEVAIQHGGIKLGHASTEAGRERSGIGLG